MNYENKGANLRLPGLITEETGHNEGGKTDLSSTRVLTSLDHTCL